MSCKFWSDHDWKSFNETYFDKRHWVENRRCNKCNDEIQVEYRVVAQNGRIETLSSITPVIQKTVQNDTNNQQTIPDHGSA